MTEIRITAKGMFSFVQASKEDLAALDEFFAVPVPHAMANPRTRNLVITGAWDGKTHFFNRFSGKLPTGLVPLITDALGKSYTIYKGKPKPDRKALKRVKGLELEGITLDEKFQRKAIRRAVKNQICILKVATNGGKTEIAAGIIRALDLPTLYIVHRKTLLHQTADRIRLRTGILPERIGDGHKGVGKVTVGIINSLPKPIKANAKFWDQFKVLIFDEAHHTSANTWYNICMKTNAKYKYALTGTPWTHHLDRDLRTLGAFRKVVIDVTNQELISRGWSATPTIHIWPADFEHNELPWLSAYRNMIAYNDEYARKVASVVKQSYEKEEPTLVIVNHVKHGYKLYKRLLSEDIECKFLTGATESSYREKVLKDFRDERLGVIVASPIFDEGVDVPAIKSLVLAGGGKAHIALLQRVGRALRRKKKGPNTVDIHDFFHKGNRHLQNHSEQRIEIYKQEKFKIKYH